MNLLIFKKLREKDGLNKFLIAGCLEFAGNLSCINLISKLNRDEFSMSGKQVDLLRTLLYLV